LVQSESSVHELRAEIANLQLQIEEKRKQKASERNSKEKLEVSSEESLEESSEKVKASKDIIDLS